MAKFTWQDGTLVSKAKVEIDGTIYEVDPEEYSGATPLSASNLNAMVDGIYDDIGDVSELETTAKGSLVDATNELNTTRLIKLWENPNPNASFANQTITLSSNDYDYLIWVWKNYVTNQYNDSTFCLKGYGVYLNLASDYNIGSGNYNVASYTRVVSRTTDTSFSVDNCYARYGNSTSRPTSNSNIIPIAVYGSKF